MLDAHHLSAEVDALFSAQNAAWYLFNHDTQEMGMSADTGEMWETWESARVAFVNGTVNWY